MFKVTNTGEIRKVIWLLMHNLVHILWWIRRKITSARNTNFSSLLYILSQCFDMRRTYQRKCQFFNKGSLSNIFLANSQLLKLLNNETSVAPSKTLLFIPCVSRIFLTCLITLCYYYVFLGYQLVSFHLIITIQIK